MGLASLIDKNEQQESLEEILAALDFDSEVTFEEEGFGSPKMVQVFPSDPAPILLPAQGSVEDLILSAADIDDALEIIERIAEKGDLFSGLNLKDSCREAVFNDEEKGLQVISFSDVSEQCEANEWSLRFVQGLVKGVSRAKKVTAKLLDGTKVLMIAGAARQVGLSREAFAEAMHLAGLDVEWGGLKKTENITDDAPISAKLEEYGIRTIPGDNGHFAFAFDALEEIPQEHRPGALRIMVENCLTDYSNISAVVAAVQSQFDKRPEFSRIKQILDRYEIAEEGLRHVLINSISANKLDPDGKLLTVLNEKADLLTTAKQSHNILVGAIRKALTMDNSMSEAVLQVIPEFRSPQSDQAKNLAAEKKTIDVVFGKPKTTVITPAPQG